MDVNLESYSRMLSIKSINSNASAKSVQEQISRVQTYQSQVADEQKRLGTQVDDLMDARAHCLAALQAAQDLEGYMRRNGSEGWAGTNWDNFEHFFNEESAEKASQVKREIEALKNEIDKKIDEINNDRDLISAWLTNADRWLRDRNADLTNFFKGQ